MDANVINTAATVAIVTATVTTTAIVALAIDPTTVRNWVHRQKALIESQLLIFGIALAAIAYAIVAFVKAHYVLIRLGWRPWRKYEATELCGSLVLLDIHTGVWYCVGENKIVRVDPNGVATTRRWR